MIKQYSYKNILSEKWNKDCIKQIKKIFKKHKCCLRYPTCIHPKNQTHPNLFQQDRSELHNHYTFIKLKETYFNALKKYLSKSNFNYSYLKVWCHMTKKHQVINKNNWHIHHEQDVKSDYEIGATLYLHDTELATEYNIDNNIVKPKVNKYQWYIWPANIGHRPEPGISKNERFVIAATIGIVDENNR
tara:strand:+ start:2061 stop:2624 length:564 start_codon:yes stop_codon:yes gene_type:complete